jgi:hypothetical protein
MCGVMFKECQCVICGVMFKGCQCVMCGVMFKGCQCVICGVMFKGCQCVMCGVMFKGCQCAQCAELQVSYFNVKVSCMTVGRSSYFYFNLIWQPRNPANRNINHKRFVRWRFHNNRLPMPPTLASTLASTLPFNAPSKQTRAKLTDLTSFVGPAIGT